ncbi:MAG: hypothetical protein IPJ76_10500 [Flavobacteriales bacterium]|nr:MAG: hypothetical protein IPJ76_10500 [Flavobacteriales bacterium]
MARGNLITAVVVNIARLVFPGKSKVPRFLQVLIVMVVAALLTALIAWAGA